MARHRWKVQGIILCPDDFSEVGRYMPTYFWSRHKAQKFAERLRRDNSLFMRVVIEEVEKAR